MTNKETQIYKAFAAGIKPEQTLSITEWAKENVRLPNSKRNSYADLNQSPWIIDPLQTIINNDYEDIVFCAVPGSGKTTLMNILGCYIVLEKPGETLFVNQKADTAQSWMETELQPILKANPKIAALLPPNKKVKRDSIKFPHMNLWVRGAAKSNLQNISIDNVIIDESWQLEDGMIEYAKARNHSRPFSSMVNMSQPGRKSKEFYRLYQSCKLMEYQYYCDHCQKFHSWEFKNLKFNKEDKLADINPVYVCSCGAEYENHPEVRRKFSTNGKYIEIPTEDPNPKRIAFVVNAGMVWWHDWRDMVFQFLQANTAKKKGNYEPLEKFKNQKLCEFWSDEEEIEIVDIKKSGYSLADRYQYAKTFLTVDVQGQQGDDHFWFCVRTWTTDGKSRLLDFGRLLSFQDITAKANEWNIPPIHVAIDPAHKTDDVLNFCATNGYLALNGGKENEYSVTVKGKPIKRIFSKIIDRVSTSGKRCKFSSFASNRTKTILLGLKTSQGDNWEIPSDIPNNYIQQLNAEKFVGERWEVCDGKDNHATDLEATQIIMALIHKCYLLGDNVTEE